MVERGLRLSGLIQAAGFRLKDSLGGLERSRYLKHMLEVTDLCKTYPGHLVALQSVNMHLERGIFGLLGPNGAGKSTLMRILATLQLPDSGSARLKDIDLITQSQQARRRIGYLPQELGVYPRVSAREVLEYLAGLKGISPRRKRQAEVATQLDRVNLTAAADQTLETYSGGMRQRFGIAAALLGEPELVIVDEPTAGLDPSERRRFQCMLAEAAHECVLILSSHIVEDVAGLCPRLAILNHGRIVLTGDPQQLVRELENHVWTLMIEPHELDTWRQRVRVLSWRPHRSRLMLRIWSNQGPPTPSCTGFTPVPPDLEDLYSLHVGQAD